MSTYVGIEADADSWSSRYWQKVMLVHYTPVGIVYRHDFLSMLTWASCMFLLQFPSRPFSVLIYEQLRNLWQVPISVILCDSWRNVSLVWCIFRLNNPWIQLNNYMYVCMPLQHVRLVNFQLNMWKSQVKEKFSKFYLFNFLLWSGPQKGLFQKVKKSN